LLICTDLDRTLIPNGPQPESPGARRGFATLVARAEVGLAYVSGRDQKLIQKAIRQYCLPRPDFVIGDAGTSVFQVDASSGEWVRQTEWERAIADDWGGRAHSAVKQALNTISALRPQEFHKQNRFKSSYYVPLRGDRNRLSATILQQLERCELRSRLVWSVDEPAGIGLLDIIPSSASKLLAIEYLMRTYHFGLDQTLFCGDSGNDLEVLTSPVKSVLVGNSEPAVRQQAQELSRQNGNARQLYIAQGGYAGMNGYYSAGVLEGIAHYFPETRAWMRLEVEREAS
jgi:hypothetical protein